MENVINKLSKRQYSRSDYEVEEVRESEVGGEQRPTGEYIDWHIMCSESINNNKLKMSDGK